MEDRTWVHPNAIRRGEPGESGRYLHYFRHWEHFTLRMDDYRFIRWVASHNTNQRPEDAAFDAAAEKLANEGWEALDKGEREVFADHQVKEIGADTLQEGVSLDGWGRLEGSIRREQFTAFAVANDPLWRPKDFDHDYQKTFTKMRVSVQSSQEENPGSMWVWGKSMREISTDDDMMDDEDALFVEFHMLPDKLRALARDVAAQPVKPTLTLHAQGLLFRDEVDAALSELWHPREYVVIYDHHHRSILNSIRFELQTGMVQAELSEDAIKHDVVRPLIGSGAQHSAHVLGFPAAMMKGLRGLKHATWILAAAIMLAALIQ